MDETKLLAMDWCIKYRLPYSEDGQKGILLSLDASGKPFKVFHNQYLNKKIANANKMVNGFRGAFDIAHLYGKLPTDDDSVEIARFDKVTKKFAFL